MSRLRRGLSKTRDILTTDIDELFTGKKISEEVLEDLEEILITADIGVQTTMIIMERLKKAAAGKDVSSASALKEVLKQEILAIIPQPPENLEQISAKPFIIMVVGVNGVGKTTTIGKLAALYQQQGKKVLIVAADTFRAAAIEQLTIWAERAGVDIIKHKANADPAAVAFDGVQAAKARQKDVVIVDTAGRLHTKINLMEELKKIKRVMSKTIPQAPHETLLVLDATTGQNALSQAALFNEAINVTGIALTKLDGTARGGIVVSISHNLDIPIKYIGVGETLEDLQKFNPLSYINALI